VTIDNRDEFDSHGISPSPVVLEHRNVCKDGFNLIDEVDAGMSPRCTN
jgi:hypothetical protein